jgi:methionyl-tRNA synthetase
MPEKKLFYSRRKVRELEQYPVQAPSRGEVKKDVRAFYITTTLPYVNSKPHIGFAMELIRADVIARYKKLMGFDVFFNTGTDEHGLKIYRKAQEEGKEPQALVDGYAETFKNLIPLLNISPDIHFIRTTDSHHVSAAQEFWKRCEKYIYKKAYKVKYCVGCELEKTESELVEGKCPIHPNLEIEVIEEENYFFKFSEFEKPLLELYEKNPHFVLPTSRLNEIREFVSRGLQDFSISRLKEKMPWGVPVPGDEDHVMYVWFDALVNYVSTLGWPEDKKTFNEFWIEGETVQYAGKDNLRQQSAMWQAMLLAAGLPLTKQIIIEGFLTSGGQKMSKSLGNVINPIEIVEEYGAEALRYFVTREFSPFEDSDVTKERLKESYNANLVNGLGNLTSRIMKMATSYGVELTDTEKQMHYYSPSENKKHEMFDQFNLAEEMNNIWFDIASLDKKIQTEEPFKKIKIDPESAKKDVHYLLFHLLGTALKLEPFMPETSKKIRECIVLNKSPETQLFPRKD